MGEGVRREDVEFAVPMNAYGKRTGLVDVDPPPADGKPLTQIRDQLKDQQP